MAKKVIIDFMGATETLKKRGVKISITDISRGAGIPAPSLYNWQKEAPVSTAVMFHCLKHTEKTFPEIMAKLPDDKALDTILWLCNETGLTFQEVVKTKSF